MKLEQYISHFLYSNDCVVVPGFGAFVARSFSAELNPATQMFLPPSKRLSFQPGLRSDDHFLRTSIARTEKRNEDVVRLEISDIVSSWHRSLHKGERLRLEGLGLFYIDRQGELQFKPQVDVNFDIYHYGLGVFRASPLIQIKEETKVVPLHEREDRKRTPMWRVAAVAAGVSGLLMIGGVKSDFSLPADFAGFDFLKWSESSDEEEITPEETDVSATPEKATEEVTTPEVEITSEPIEAVPAEKGVYYVIVGSFVEKANAEDLYRELQQKGHTPHILPFDGRFSKVAISSFASRSDAANALRTYKNEVQRGAWIYRK